MIRIFTEIKAHWISCTLVLLFVITLSSLWPLDELPPIPGTDKTHHLIAYALLVIPSTLRKPEKRIFFGLLFMTYSGGIELIQPYVNRYGEWMDMLANVGGIICGLIIVNLINIFYFSSNDQF